MFTVIIQSVSKHLGGLTLNWAQYWWQICQHRKQSLESVKLKGPHSSLETNKLKLHVDSSWHQRATWLTSHLTKLLPNQQTASLLTLLSSKQQKQAWNWLPSSLTRNPLLLWWHFSHLHRLNCLTFLITLLPTTLPGVDTHPDQGCLRSFIFTSFHMSAASLGSRYRHLILRMKPCK